MEFKDLIKKRRMEIGATLEEIGNRVGVAKATVQRWESGEIENVRRDKIDKLAKALQTTPAYLMGWEEDNNADIFSHPDILPIKKKRFPLIGGIACGQPTYKEEDFESYVEAGCDINADFAMRCHGDSMINIGVKDGYIVFIRKQSTVENGEIAALNIDGEFTLKRFFNYGNLLVLRSENSNPEYTDLEYKENDANNIIVLGKAVAFQGGIK